MLDVGLMGKQSTEAIHAHFNKLYKTYGSMVNQVLKLIKVHHARTLPQCVSQTIQSMRLEKTSRKRKHKNKA